MYSHVSVHLQNLANGVLPDDPTEGICMEIKKAFGPDVMETVITHIPKWTRHSGVELFPVPCPDGYDPKLRYKNTRDLWAGKYGQLRRELCGFLAGELLK